MSQFNDFQQLPLLICCVLLALGGIVLSNYLLLSHLSLFHFSLPPSILILHRHTHTETSITRVMQPIVCCAVAGLCSWVCAGDDERRVSCSFMLRRLLCLQQRGRGRESVASSTSNKSIFFPETCALPHLHPQTHTPTRYSTIRLVASEESSTSTTEGRLCQTTIFLKNDF